MASPFEIRIMVNQPGRGWYWEVVAADREVVARGVAATHEHARAQAADAAQQVRNAQAGIEAGTFRQSA